MGGSKPDHSSKKPGTHVLAEAALLKQPFLIDHPQEHSLVPKEFAKLLGSSSFAVVPLVPHQETLGVLLVDNQPFKFEDAKTKLLELAPTQHSLDIKKVDTKVAELDAICAEIDGELDDLEQGLRLRHMALIPIWVFTLGFATLWYVKYKQLHKDYVTE